MIDEKWEASYRDHQKFHSEGIMISIIGCLKFHVDQVHRGIGTGNVDELKRKEKNTKLLMLYNCSNSLGFSVSPIYSERQDLFP